MVSTMLLFTRAQRDGLWDLHLASFRQMIPFFMRYDHYNYACWGPIHLSDVDQLPENLKCEFMRGNFVVKRSAHTFKKVGPDQAQEWLNGTGKKSGEITKKVSALRRWTLSCNHRSQIAADTHNMYNLCSDVKIHNEQTPSHGKRDNQDENALLEIFQRFNVFSNNAPSKVLQSVTTKDLATAEIQKSLLNARTLSKKQLQEFVGKRLLVSSENMKPKLPIQEPIKRNNALTFEGLYDVVKDSKEKDKRVVMKADRNILLCLITAYESGRPVDLANILKPVPTSLAEMDGTIRTGNKSILAEILTTNIACPEKNRRSSISIFDH